MNEKRRCAFAVCGSFCTLETALEQAQELTARGWELLPVMSNTAARRDTRFGRAGSWRERLEALTGHLVLDSLQAVEPLGPKNMAEALVIAPCTGSHAGPAGGGPFRHAGDAGGQEPAAGGAPGGDGRLHQRRAGGFGENIARLYQRKHYYFVPYGQDDPQAKPQSLKARFARLPAALDAALARAAAAAGAAGQISKGKVWYTEQMSLRVQLSQRERAKMWYTIIPMRRCRCCEVRRASPEKII